MDERRTADRRQKDQLLTDEEIADLAKVPVNTVRHWRQTGTLPFVRIGKHPRVWLSAFYGMFRGALPQGCFAPAANPATIPSARDIRRVQ